MELNGRIALVTGSAKRVGRAVAIALAKAGADIALHYCNSAEQAQAAAQEIHALGRRAEVFQADLVDPDQIARMFKVIGEIFSRLDVLVNNAAAYHRTPIETLTAEQWDAEFAVNARAPALCIRHAIPLMTAGGGAIVNITDVGADSPRANFPAYCASKAAMAALTRSAAKALAGRGIRVNAVAPGLAAWAEDTSEQEKQAVLARIPMKRIGSVDDVAAAVVFLCRQDYITGQSLRVDGGWCTI